MSIFDDRDADLQAVSAGSVASGKSAGGIWMVTFVDLVLLLFGFFVLLFSMSSLETAGPMPDALAVLPTRADAPIRLEKTPARADANIGARSQPRAAATEYLTVLLRDALDRVPTLRPLRLDNEGDDVRLSVPPALWSGAAPGLGDLAALLDRLDNRVMIIAPTQPSRYASYNSSTKVGRVTALPTTRLRPARLAV
ncbi:flagellar motor protein MotB [Pararhodospirillum photometricum]|uniref:flagellar motor protein MotB n=1 Tax=Pararhodospirillum photometricum TaxID=1084 RepID=UPI0006841095|nr:flagellar motor protein MotB [Pararhodospirillum photometricum]